MEHSERKFLKGVAMSVWQSSFDKSSQWSAFIRGSWNPLKQSKFRAAYEGCANFWDNYKDDIKEIKNLGGTSLRFTIEWARLQPNGPDEYDQEAVERYRQMLDCMQEQGIEPMATLHQFVHPEWFERLGGFEKAENIHMFVSFCVEMFKLFGQRIKLWAILNEANIMAGMGWIAGVWPPGKMMRLMQSGEIIANMLRAHCAAYRAIKRLPGNDEAMIGFAHHHIAFFPAQNVGYLNWICKWLNNWVATYSVMEFFKTGVFVWRHPLRGERVLYVDEGIRQGERLIDWWGVNYYTRPAVHWNMMIGPGAPHEPVSDERFRLAPQGLYDSLKDASCLGVPIYITEMGVADQQDRHRAWYAKACYAMVLKAIADGIDVRGAYWWTLEDNCEWHTGFDIKFGLFEWKPEYVEQYKHNGNRPPGGLKLKEGGKAVKQVYLAWPNEMDELKAFARKTAAECVTPMEGGYITSDRWTREHIGRNFCMPGVHGADLAYQSLEATYRLTAASGTPPVAPSGGTSNRYWLGFWQVSVGPKSHEMGPKEPEEQQLQQNGEYAHLAAAS